MIREGIQKTLLKTNKKLPGAAKKKKPRTPTPD